jgi:hypothetical protein
VTDASWAVPEQIRPQSHIKVHKGRAFVMFAAKYCELGNSKRDWKE